MKASDSPVKKSRDT